jgi:hypothetical protein
MEGIVVEFSPLRTRRGIATCGCVLLSSVCGSRRSYCTFDGYDGDQMCDREFHGCHRSLPEIDPPNPKCRFENVVSLHKEMFADQHLFSGWNHVDVDASFDLDLRYIFSVYQMLVLLEGAHRVVLQVDQGLARVFELFKPHTRGI